MEAHGQNVMMGINSKGMPTGKFYHRDNGGMNIDMESPYFPKEMIKDLPFARDVKTDYHQDFRATARNTSLAIYFETRVLYNIYNEIRRIDPTHYYGSVMDDLWIELQAELLRTTKLKKSQMKLERLINRLDEVITRAALAPIPAVAGSCHRVLMSAP